MRPVTRLLSASVLLLAAGSAQAALVPVSAATGLAAPDTVLDFDTATGFLGLVYTPVPEVEIEGLSLNGFSGFSFPNFSGRWINPARRDLRALQDHPPRPISCPSRPVARRAPIP